ncbi:MAG: Asp-tRNA(Asn)/Glu-tRNA(Gln) amidotransferase subunit GatA [Oscillospiraceae bacterium]|nr:Asp-tRNA(Asn)/Glu-tRNA(Gln) amidotransferase subunit GatA [Oscillospiraceae bacterium]
MSTQLKTIKELGDMLRARQISAVELTEEYLAKISGSDRNINSYISVCADEARAQAKEAQDMLDSGNASPLTGIPLSIKDNICTEGIKTTCASKMLEDFVPVYDATVIRRLKSDGAVMLGKTNMDEFAMGGSSQTSYFGGVKNPFDTSRVTGGSSGGAAASVAGGMCAGALGSDTGGSVRQPASFCGVTGLKPTYGAVSRYGLIAFASSLDQIGVIANSACDCGIILSRIAGYDENDGTSAKNAGDDYISGIGMSVKGIKIGIPEEFFSAGTDENVKESVTAAAEFYKSAGAELVSVSMPSLKYAVPAYYLISSAEAASNLSRYDGIKFGWRSDKGDTFGEVISNTRREGFGDEVKRRILLGNYALSSGYYDAYYNSASRIRTRLRKEYDEIFEKCDFIITPTAPTTAYKIGSVETDPVKMYLADICTVTVNIAGLPAISTPCGYDENGMPVGMSIIGKTFDEKGIIALCDVFERNFDRREARI